MKISLDLSREFAYDAGKVKEFKTKVRAPKGSGEGKKSFSVPLSSFGQFVRAYLTYNYILFTYTGDQSYSKCSQLKFSLVCRETFFPPSREYHVTPDNNSHNVTNMENIYILRLCYNFLLYLHFLRALFSCKRICDHLR